MSNQSPAYPHPEYASRHPHGRAQSAGAVSRHVQRAHGQRAGYTLTHGGRQVRVGPVAFWIVVGTLVIMAVWSIGTGTYFAFREDVLTRLIGRQADMQFAYEDRISELRAQVDRITSRQLLDQEQFEQKLNALLKRTLHALLHAGVGVHDVPTFSTRGCRRITHIISNPESPRKSPIRWIYH